MMPTVRSLAFAASGLLTTGLVQALTQARAPAHRPWWRQLQAGVHAFGGLIGVALIVAAAVVLLLLADRWLVDRPPHDDEQTRR